MHTRPFLSISVGSKSWLVAGADPVALAFNQCLCLLQDLLIGFMFGDAFGEGRCICVDLCLLDVSTLFSPGVKPLVVRFAPWGSARMILSQVVVWLGADADVEGDF
jgi:hypothetical protein